MEVRWCSARSGQQGSPLESNLLPFQKFCQMPLQLKTHLMLVQGLAHLLGQRRHPTVGDAARDDQIKKRQIRVHVERQAMHGDPAAALDPKSTNFPCGLSRCRVDPNPSQSFDSPCRHPVVLAGADDRFLEQSQVLVDVCEELIKVEDGVPDNLSGAVVSDVSPSVDGVILHPQTANSSGDTTTWAASPLLPSVSTWGCSTQSILDWGMARSGESAGPESLGAKPAFRRAIFRWTMS